MSDHGDRRPVDDNPLHLLRGRPKPGHRLMSWREWWSLALYCLALIAALSLPLWLIAQCVQAMK